MLTRFKIEEIDDEVLVPFSAIHETSSSESSSKKTKEISKQMNSQSDYLPTNTEYLQPGKVNMGTLLFGVSKGVVLMAFAATASASSCYFLSNLIWPLSSSLWPDKLIFFLATSIWLIPAAYLTVKAGKALGELRSVGDLYDIRPIGTLSLIGLASITPTLLTNRP